MDYNTADFKTWKKIKITPTFLSQQEQEETLTKIYQKGVY